MILFSLVEKQRNYYQQEETPEVMAARIDRDVVSEIVIFISLAFFLKEKLLTGKIRLISIKVFCGNHIFSFQWWLGPLNYFFKLFLPLCQYLISRLRL